MSAAFFEEAEKESQKTCTEFLENDYNQILNRLKDKLEIDKHFYKKLYSAAVINETLQNQFLKHVPSF